MSNMKEGLNDDTVTICNYVYEALVVCGINEDDYETTRRRPFPSVSLSFMFSGISDNKPSINYPMCRAYVQLAAITLI